LKPLNLEGEVLVERKVARGTIYLIMGQIAFLVSGYAIHLSLARYLGPETYGMYGLIISLLIWVELAVISGIPTAVKKYVAESNHLVTAIKKKAVSMQALYSGAIFVLLLALSPVIANLLGDKRVGMYLRIAAFDIPFYAFFHLYLGVINGVRDFGRQAMSVVTYSLGKVIATLVLVFLGLSLVGALGGRILASFFGLTVTMLFCRSYGSGHRAWERVNFDSAEIFKFAIPIVLLSLTRQLLMSLDLFCVKALVEDGAQTGFYTSAVALAKAPYFVFFALTCTLFPSLVKSIADGNKELTTSYINQALRFLSVLAIPFVFLVIPTSENLISLAFSDTYLPAAALLPILIIGLTFFTFFVTLTTIMVADDKPYLAFYIALAMIALDFLLNLKLIPIYGTVGAAWATTLATLIGMIIVAGFVFHRFRTLVDPVSVLKVVVGSFIIYAIARLYQAPQMFLLLEYIVLFALYVAILFLMKEIKKRDIEALMIWAKSR